MFKWIGGIIGGMMSLLFGGGPRSYDVNGEAVPWRARDFHHNDGARSPGSPCPGMFYRRSASKRAKVARRLACFAFIVMAMNGCGRHSEPIPTRGVFSSVMYVDGQTIALKSFFVGTSEAAIPVHFTVYMNGVAIVSSWMTYNAVDGQTFKEAFATLPTEMDLSNISLLLDTDQEQSYQVSYSLPDYKVAQ